MEKDHCSQTIKEYLSVKKKKKVRMKEQKVKIIYPKNMKVI